MCGIAGIHHYRRPDRPVARELVERMTRSLAHRGPDGEGVYCDGELGFGHRRLAIIDPSPAGDQPMLDAERRLVITYNGEIYNFRELRQELLASGHLFRSQSDTEVLLAGYREWGLELLSRLNGIFALGLFDLRARELLLVRDPLGVKPLFYADDGARVSFGSEIKALLCDRTLQREVDDRAIDAFFTFNYTPAPATGVRGIRQLEPGSYRLWSADGSSGRRYWEPANDGGDGDALEAPAAFRAAFEAAVERQMIADVPVGSLLSGGLDSAAIALALARSASPPSALYHGRFSAAAYDDSAAAGRIAESLDLPLVEFPVDRDAADLPVAISRHLEEPTADSSAIAFSLLAGEVAREVKVVLSGEGADELLAGYATYQATLVAAALRRLGLSRLVAAGAGAVARLLPVRDVRYPRRDLARRFALYAAEPGLRAHASWRTIFSPPLKRRLYAADFARRASAWDPVAPYATAAESCPAHDDDLSRALWMDLRFYLPNDMLVKADRMGMMHGLEVRVPFLDLALVSRVARLPPELKLRRLRRRKHLLREMLDGALPAGVLAGSKSGFNVPVETYFRGAWGDLLMDIVASVRDRFADYLRPAAVEELLTAHRERRDDHRHVLFGTLMFGLWLYNLERAWR